MKTFSSAYYISKKQSIAEKETLIEQEHNKIIAAMKKEFGINSFSTLNESEKKYYRSMLKEMWNREKGLTAKGIKFINEATAPLTPDSTPEQIKKAFQREIKANINNYLAVLLGGNGNISDAGKLKSKLESELKKKISTKECKQWIYEIVSKELAKKINAFKF